MCLVFSVFLWKILIMKTLYFVIASVILCSFTAHAQFFSVTPEGLRSTEKSENTFVVIPIEGFSAHRLFERSIMFVNERRKDAKESTKGQIADEYLRFSTFEPNFIMYPNGPGVKVPIDATYDIDLKFKDGKIRLEFVDVLMKGSRNNKYQVLFSGGLFSGYIIFKKNGDIFKESVKEDIEKYFNAVVNDLVEYIKGDKKNNEW